jgi:dTDP-4-dehydrorhamnose 3,5-epimerase
MIEGVRLLEVPRFSDERGTLTQIFEEAKELPKARRIYIVKNWNQNTVRAFHKNFSETKYFYVISGAVKFVLVDDREKSSTYRQKNTFVLTSEKREVLIVPPEVYNGWKALTDNAVLLGMANTTMKEHRDERVAHDSFEVNWR